MFYLVFLLSMALIPWTAFVWAAYQLASRYLTASTCRFVGSALHGVVVLVPLGLMVDPSVSPCKSEEQQLASRQKASQIVHHQNSVDLNSDQVNQLLSAISPRIHPKIELTNDKFEGELGLALPWGFSTRCQLAGEAKRQAGKTTLNFHRLTLGDLSVSQPLRWYLSELLLASVNIRSETSQAMDSVVQMEIKQTRFHISFRPEFNSFPSNQVARSTAPNPQQSIVFTIVKNWHRTDSLESDVTFDQAVGRLFRRARGSAPNDSPSEQNRIALTAGAILFADRQIAMSLLEKSSPSEILLSRTEELRLNLHGRPDLAQRFWTNVGARLLKEDLTVEITPPTLEGLTLKMNHENDSVRDILADHAGNRFVMIATTPATAIEAQVIISGNWDQTDICPRAEGIPDQLNRKSLNQLIEQRLQTCRLLNLPAS